MLRLGMKKIILMLIIPIYIIAYEFRLTANDINTIKNSAQKKYIVNRLYKFKNLKKKIKNSSLEKKLILTNNYFNKINYSKDIKKTGFIDHWSTPKEFLMNGYGDCEDYVIAKYFTLIESGINKKDLYLSIVNVKGEKRSHMVLLHYFNKNKAPLVLDSLSFKVLPLNKRSDLKPILVFNEFNSFKINKQGQKEKALKNWHKKEKWNKLLKRTYSNT